MKRTFRLAPIAAATICTAFVASGCCNHGAGVATAAKTIIIGTDFATSGADATAGVPTQNGVELAIEDEQKRGLPDGYSLALQTEDDTVQGVHNAGQGVRNVEALLQDSRVLAIVGPQNSSVARAEIPVSNEAEIALISPSATSVLLTDDSQGAAALRRAHPAVHTFFRTVLRDDLQGEADATFARNALHARRAYVIDDSESYGRGIADVFARWFAMDGGTVIERAHLTPNQEDFVAMLTRVRSMSPDLVFYGGVVSTGAPQLRRQMVKLGMTMPLMGGDGLKDQGFIDAAGAAANGVYCSYGSPNLEILPSATRFLAGYQQAFPGQVLGTYSASAYAATQVAVDAIRKLIAHGGVAPTRLQVVNEIASTSTQATPLGDISFTRAGDITNPVVSIWIIKNGQFVFLSQQQEKLER